MLKNFKNCQTSVLTLLLAVTAAETVLAAEGDISLSDEKPLAKCTREQGGTKKEQNPETIIGAIALSVAANNTHETVENILEIFRGSPLLEMAGEGIPELGELRARAIIGEYIYQLREIDSLTLGGTHPVIDILESIDAFDRLETGNKEEVKEELREIIEGYISRRNANRFSGAQIRSLINERISREDFGEGREWKVMEGLNPGVKKGEEWDKSKQSDRNKKRWFALFEVYKRYRDEFNPLHKEGEADKDEFEPLAQNFYDWYMGRSHKYQDMKKRDAEAARERFLVHVAEGLLDHIQTGEEGQPSYRGYHNYQGLVKELIKAPVNIEDEEESIDYTMDKEIQRQKKHEETIKKIERETKWAFDILKAMKGIQTDHINSNLNNP